MKACSVNLLAKSKQSLQDTCKVSSYIKQHGLHLYKPRPYKFECDHIRGAIEIPDRASLKDKLRKLKQEGSANAAILTDYD